jgi:hypothetical protein
MEVGTLVAGDAAEVLPRATTRIGWPHGGGCFTYKFERQDRDHLVRRLNALPFQKERNRN